MSDLMPRWDPSWRAATGATEEQLEVAARLMWKGRGNDDDSDESFEIEKDNEVREMSEWASVLVPVGFKIVPDENYIVPVTDIKKETQPMGRIDRTAYKQLMISGLFEKAVAAEMNAQDLVWGYAPERAHTISDWALILGREYGEVLDEAGNVIWNRVDRDPGENWIALRSELIQLAAVAGQIVAVVDSNLDLLKDGYLE